MPPTAPMQAKWGEGNLAQAGDLMAGAELTASSSDEIQILKYLQEVRKALNACSYINQLTSSSVR